MPLSEAQGRWVAEYLKGEYALPAQPELRRFIAEDYAAMQKRYVASKRHTIQVDFGVYVADLMKEIGRGAKRATAAGNTLPVPARADLTPAA